MSARRRRRPAALASRLAQTRRIWKRNVSELAGAGLTWWLLTCVASGTPGLLPDDRYDAAAYSHDMAALLREALGHVSAVVCAGTSGAWWPRTCRCATRASSPDSSCSTRSRRCRSTAPEGCPARCAWRRLLHLPVARRRRPRGGARHGGKAAALHRAVHGIPLLGGAGITHARGSDWLTEPFADPDHFRASIANYEYVGGSAQRPSRRACWSPTSPQR